MQNIGEVSPIQRIYDLLSGIVFEIPSKLPGKAKILNSELIDSDRLVSLFEIPGVTKMDGAGGGLFIPHNLLHIGESPANLFEYPPDSYSTTPVTSLPLKDHQRRSITFLRQITKQHEGCILGSDPGLGKTCMSLQALWLDGYLHRTGLIIGPLGSKATWCDPGSDPKVHYQLTIIPLEGNDPEKYQGETNNAWFFIHYDILDNWQNWVINKLRPCSLIVDESHYAMNSQSKRFKSLQQISMLSCIERRYLLTGTPIPKTRMDLFGQLAIAQPRQWGGANQTQYGLRYAAGYRQTYEEGKGHFVFEGQSNTEELRARLAGVYLRYTKADIPGELPELIRHRIDVELSEDVKDEYFEARKDIVKYLRGKKEPTKVQGQSQEQSQNKPQLIIGKLHIDLASNSKEDNTLKAVQLTCTSVLKSIIAKGKLPYAKKIICELIGQHKRLVVFTWMRQSAKTLICELLELQSTMQSMGHEKVPDIFGPIDGTDPWHKRHMLAREFAKSKWGIFVATRGALGISINPLSCADACLQTMPDWNPDSNLQAESRLHREGNRHKTVHSYYLIAPGTIDEHIIDLLREKSEEAKAMSSYDKGGAHLVQDLDPSGGTDDTWNLDQLCSMLSFTSE